MTEQARGGPFLLAYSLFAPPRAGVPIELSATLTYDGPESEIVVYSSGSGPIAFAVAQVGGPIRVDPIRAGSCEGTILRRGVPYVADFQKTGAFDPDATGPVATFYREYFARPELVLAEGEWATAAVFELTVGDCSGESFGAQASVDLDVGP